MKSRITASVLIVILCAVIGAMVVGFVTYAVTGSQNDDCEYRMLSVENYECTINDPMERALSFSGMGAIVGLALGIMGIMVDRALTA